MGVQAYRWENAVVAQLLPFAADSCDDATICPPAAESATTSTCPEKARDSGCFAGGTWLCYLALIELGASM